MSQDFTTRLQLQLREAALREERRTPLGRRLADLRLGAPAPGPAVAVALALALVAVVVALGGLRWGGGEETVTHPRVIGNFPVADNLGFLSSGFGSVWVADVKQLEVLRLDPRTHRVQARIPTGGDTNAFNGDPIINVGAGAVWAVARAPSSDGGHRVLRIDPETNRVTARVMLPARQAPVVFDLQTPDGQPWVITSRGAIELDPATAKPRRFVSSHQSAGEPGPQWTIAFGNELWVLTREARIDRYSLADGHRTGSTQVRLANTVAVIPSPDGVVLVTLGGELALADAADGRVLWRRQVGNGVSIPLGLGRTLWVPASDVEGGRDRLVEMELRSGRVRSSTALPEFGVTGMAVVGDELWLATKAGTVTVVARD